MASESDVWNSLSRSEDNVLISFGLEMEKRGGADCREPCMGAGLQLSRELCGGRNIVRAATVKTSFVCQNTSESDVWKSLSRSGTVYRVGAGIRRQTKDGCKD